MRQVVICPEVYLTNLALRWDVAALCTYFLYKILPIRPLQSVNGSRQLVNLNLKHIQNLWALLPLQILQYYVVTNSLLGYHSVHSNGCYA